MNKHFYRVIFSKTLQRLVVVSEIVSSEGKSKNEINVSTVPTLKSSEKSLFQKLPISWSLKPLSVVVYALMGVIQISPAQSMQIIADKQAPKQQQAVILETANGIPQVNIQTPNSKGLSHNKYQQFDVDKKGAILNNSRKNVQTQQAGWIQANPYLAGGEAKVILNEVNSSQASQLKGYIEVAGAKADVIIANPSGIHCESCGVINAGRSTLTTGEVQLENGQVKGYQVQKGTITVAGRGLDTSSSDYTDIIAKEVQVNGKIWANDLKVTTGKNKVSAHHDSIEVIAAGNAPAIEGYALDVSELGGMYAGSIQLVGTESGLGVRNAGHIGASSGDVVIDVNGRIVNQNTIQAQQNIKGVAKGESGVIDNQASAKILANQGKIRLDAEKSFKQSGVIGAKESINIHAQSLDQTQAGEIEGGEVRLSVKDKLTNRGLINSQLDDSNKTAKTVIKASEIQNIGTGRIYGDHVALQANTIENIDELTETSTRQDPIIAAYQRLDVAAPTIVNQTAHYLPQQKSASTLFSEKDIVFGRQLNADDQAIGQADTLLNDSSTIEAANGDIVLNVREVKNLNTHFKSEIETISDEKINETYIIPQGYLTKDRINFNLLKWIPFSRAGKLAYRQDATESLQAGEDITSNTLLPMANEYVCQDYADPASCQIKPESIYDANHPAWAYFNLTPPSQMPSDLPKIEYPDEPQPPVAVVEPDGKRIAETQEQYEKRLADYEQAKKDYETALLRYEEEKRTYPERLKAYQQAMVPFQNWLQENEQSFEALNQKINAHNSRLLGKTFSHFWITKLNQRVKQASVVKTTLPGQILAGKNIEFHSDQVLNDRSQIIAGNQLSMTGTVLNQDETGYDIVTEYGTKQWTNDRWRGGFKRYFQRSWSSVYDYNNYVNTPYQMGVAVKQEHTAYQENEGTQPAVVADPKAISLLPNTRFYRLNPDADSHVLIETDPAFASRGQWLSSDYMFTMLRNEPQHVHKRLGDGFYEQRLVREQIHQLTGKAWLDNYENMESQYKALMNSGISFAQKFHLTLGVALSPEQIQQLTTDIVWLEEQDITLPEGKTVTVLVPRVYVVPKEGDLSPQGSLLSGKVVDLNTQYFNNSGVVLGDEMTSIQSDHLLNEGLIVGKKVDIRTRGDFDNIGGRVEANDDLSIHAEGNINHRSTTVDSDVVLSHFKRQEMRLGREASFYAKGKEARLYISANDLNVQAAQIINAGSGELRLEAQNNLNLTTLSTRSNEQVGEANHYRYENTETAIRSQIKGEGNTTLMAKNILSEGADISSQSRLAMVAENDIQLKGAKERSSFEEFHRTKSGSIAKVTKTRLDKQHTETTVGTKLNAQEILISSGKDVTAQGVQAVADQDLTIQAAHNIDVTADTQYYKNSQIETKKKSGVFTGGGAGITFGSQTEKHELEETGWTQSDARSSVGSLNANVVMQAGGHVNVKGADVIATQANSIDIKGGSVTVDAGKDLIERDQKHEFKSSGLTIAFSSAVTDAAMKTDASLTRSKQVKDSRLQALYGIKAAQESIMLAQEVAQVAEAVQSGQNADFKISISIGSSQSKSSSHSTKVTHQGSSLNAGKVMIDSTAGNIDMIGSKIQATQAQLSSAEHLTMTATQDTVSQRSKNKNSGWSLGVFLGSSGGSYGFGIEGSAQIGKGHENSDSIHQNNNQIHASSVVLKSAQDTTLKGAEVNGDALEVVVGRNLSIESLQDEQHYDSKQVQAGVSASVAIYGSGSNASINASMNKAKVNYAQVEKQSGLYAGKEGLNVDVNGHTHLKGSVIDSQAEADKNRLKTGSLSSENIHNYSEARVQSISAGFSTSMEQNAMSSLMPMMSALGNINRSDSGTTYSAISDRIQIVADQGQVPSQLLRDTTHANQKVQQQDMQELKERQEMAQVIGEIANNAITLTLKSKIDKAEKDKKEADAILEKDPDNLQALLQRGQAVDVLEKYGQDSTIQTSIRAATVILQGLATGSTSQAVVGGLSPFANHMIRDATEDKNKQVNLTPNLIAHAVLGAVESYATGNNALAGATAAVTAEVVAKVVVEQIYEKPVYQLTESEKEKVATFSQMASGLVGGIVGDSTSNAIVSSEIGKRAVENNYLSDAQQAQYEAELKKCENFWCKFKTELYWTGVSAGQNAAFGAGVLAAVPKELADTIKDVFELVTNPSQVYDAFQFLFSQENIAATLINSLKQDFINRIEILKSEYEKAGAKGAYNAGKELGGIIIEIGSAISGVGGITKTSVKIISTGIKQSVHLAENTIKEAKKIIKKTNNLKNATEEVKDVSQVAKNEVSIKAKPTENKTSDQRLEYVCNTGKACFVAGTLVETVNGLKPIEQIGYGELVWSREEFGDQYDYQPVLANSETEKQETIEVIVQNEHKVVERFITTKEHPFFVNEEGWIKASLLESGMKLLDRQGNPSLTVVSQKETGKLETVYNIKVEHFSTYHIGHFGVWVHNAECCDFTKRYGDPEKIFREGDWVDPKTNRVRYLNPFDGEYHDFPDEAKYSIDHILPKSEFLKIKGFRHLPEEVQERLMNNPNNLQPLPKHLNSSKGNKIETETSGWEMYEKGNLKIHPKYRKFLKDRQDAVRKFVEDEIERIIGE
ncbi:two-partner secretion domain-containing protein [Basilea psittacipulmonis]|uniref:Uncharacterized protein n=1 Tax=Basilea psittacipulmonis DSM 24701 TaxID=1072685 RepID=A0A077DFV6_9BURK|nr:hemagglutinin repeat-containing protein [Basilea psittacipulmonis]AIL32247.1 hypothetical protein IX83_01995 [Basilea psittacipulmonis DSM 24701]